MDEFTYRLNSIDKRQLKNFLSSLKTPCYESTLLKLVFPDMVILSTRTIELYHYHFLLFHLLFKFQEEYYHENKYLFVHFMRTFLSDYPDPGKCRHYEEDSGKFCQTPCRGSYCDFHSRIVGESELEHLSMKYFYLDPSNYDNLDETAADAFISGAWDLLTNFKHYHHCFSVLDMPETWNIQDIKKKFKFLAKQYHPDMGRESQEKFIEINNAYHLLMRLIPEIAR